MTAGTELALVGVTTAAVLGLVRLFSNGSFLVPALLAVAASHALGWACRRQGIGPLLSSLLSGAGLVLAVVWLVEPHTTTFGIPGGGTWNAINADLQQAWERFSDVKAPAEPLRGFVLVVVASAWVTAAAADLFAFRMRARFEAMAPAFTLFVFGSILGADKLRLPATTLYLAAVLSFVLWSEAARRSGTGSWFAGRAREGDAALLRQGATMGLVALAVALLLGPHIPGASSSGLVSWKDGKEGSSRSRVTVSPLVDIRGRLVDQSNIDLFAVRSNAPSYWRLTSLERFDGTIWSSLGTYQTTRGPLPGRPGGETQVITQEFDIGPLGTIWLPAAFRPERVSGVKGARFDRDSASLLADSSTADDLRYSVVSEQPRLSEAQLAGASSAVPADVARRYLSLPEGFPADVTAEARRQTAAAATPYEKARALQDWFRREFEYDLDIPAGHDVDAIVRFLAVRRGYCEQFAGTYAAMARAIGLPARVAVGFIPGTVQADGRYLVAGRDAHAWPEVYLAGFGWVAFEPTPGRSAPGAESYTGVPSGNSPSQPAATTPTSAPPTTTGDGTATTRPEREEIPEPEQAPATSSGLSGLALFVLVLGGLVVAAAAAIPLGRHWLTQRRRASAATPSDKVLVAWAEAEEALAMAGHARRRSETATEFAARAASAVGEAGDDLNRLAGTTTAAGFDPEGVPLEVVTPSQEAAAAVEGSLRTQAGPWRRLRWALDPRPLVSAAQRHRHTQRAHTEHAHTGQAAAGRA
ncbi:MAG: transglutaminaseTgpA domain-containing protein [Acidimicrobiales bacterium]